MAELKTQENNASVPEFIAGISDEQQRKEAKVLLKLMKEATGLKPKMWGDSMVGFGRYHYKYKTGHEGDWFKAGFSPRKGSFSIYIMSGFGPVQEHLDRLGKHKLGKCCLYVKRLDDVDLDVLKELVKASLPHVGHCT